jgi:hypothetical protein
MTDHKAEALGALSEILLHFDEGENGTARATIAQVHSTLYLAEQQRTANLMAAASKWGGEPASWPLAIREGLGI